MDENANIFTQKHADFQANAGKSCSHFMVKFLVIAMLLCVLPMFPSDPPEFISQTVFAKSWELIHLLVIGICLCYGLFCRPKTGQVPSKNQSSQLFASNILHHSSIFNYEEGNPSAFCDNTAIPTKSFEHSWYGKEPFLDLKRVNCKMFDDKPLGLPVRSLRSRVLDSDSEEEQDDSASANASASDCESDLSEKHLGSFSPTTTTTQYGPTQMGWGSRGSFSPTTFTTTQYGSTEVGSRASFSPTTTSTSQYGPTEVGCRASFSPITTSTTHYGPTEVEFGGSFSPILRKSQSMRSDYYMGENGNVEAKQVNFHSFRSPVQEASTCQRAAGFCSWVPESPNNFYLPFSNFTPVNNFNMAGLSPNAQNTSTNFFMPSSVSPSMPFPAGDFASTYSKFTHENEHWSNPQFMNGHMSVENSGVFMPSTAATFPMSAPASDFGSMSRRYNYEPEYWSRSQNLQGGVSGGGFPNCSMPTAAAFPPSMPSSAENFAPSDEATESEKFNHASPVMTRDESRSENHNGKKEDLMTKKVDPLSPNFIHLFSDGKSPEIEIGESGGIKLKPSVISLVNEFAASQGVKLKHGPSVQKEEENSEKNDADGKKLKPSVFCPVNELVAPQGVKSKQGPSVQKKDEKSEKKNVDGKKVETSVFSFVNELAASQSAEVKHQPSVQGDEERSETGNVEGEKFNPSVLSFVNEFSALRDAQFKHGPCDKKDEEKPGKDKVAILAINEENKISSMPQFVDLSAPTPKLVVSPKKNEQRTSPERWDDDCFVIPLSENNDMGGDSVQENPNNDIGDDLVQENPTLELSDSSSEAPSSARSSFRMPLDEQNLPQNEVEDNFQRDEPITNSEIVEFAVENESYKPSTPSPPPQIQTRRNNPLVDSSLRTLANRPLINNVDQVSLPTPEERKALMKPSHSRRFSCGPFFDRDLRKSFKDETKEANRKPKGDHQFAKGSKCGCLMLDVKPSFNKAALKGKSVRTLRPKEISNSQQKNDHNEGKHKGDNAGKREGDNSEMVVIKIGIKEKSLNSNGRKTEKLQGGGATSILVGLNSKQNSNGTSVVPIVHEIEEENDSEIDKKADEFIAKFKEQIRLQKFNSKGESSRHQKFMYHT